MRLKKPTQNLSNPGQRGDLEELLGSVEVVPSAAPTDHPLLSAMELPAKDWPILLAAIGVGATHLLSGDLQNFALGPSAKYSIQYEESTAFF